MTNMNKDIGRRTLVKGATLLGVSIFTGAHLGAAPASAATSLPASSDASRKERLKSLNGWTLEDRPNHISTVWTRPVPGTGLSIDVRVGVVETVLVHLIRRYHYEIDELRAGDLVGWRSPAEVRQSLPESNLASGTAVRIRPGHYPVGTSGGYFIPERAVLRDILAELDGVIRWGGDDDPSDESLFSVDVGPESQKLQRVAARIRAGYDVANRGAGIAVDPNEPGRRRAALKLESAQSAVTR
jgi:hypothetical protein